MNKKQELREFLIAVVVVGSMVIVGMLIAMMLAGGVQAEEDATHDCNEVTDLCGQVWHFTEVWVQLTGQSVQVLLRDQFGNVIDQAATDASTGVYAFDNTQAQLGYSVYVCDGLGTNEYLEGGRWVNPENQLGNNIYARTYPPQYAPDCPTVDDNIPVYHVYLPLVAGE